MQLALQQAHLAEELGEIPVGAVVLLDGKVVGVGHNQTIGTCDPTAHAEVVALRAAAKFLGNYRLDQCSLYVTLEPCPMCMGAILHSRIAKVFFGAFDPKTGACGSVLNLPNDPRINHHCEVVGGVSQAQCSQHLSRYFEHLRTSKRHARRPRTREDALRLTEGTLSTYMEGVESQLVDDLQAADGLRVQTWKSPEASRTPQHLVLCLHGATSWSYIYRDLLRTSRPENVMLWAVDLPGHGGSDKTKKGLEFNVKNQLALLCELLERSSASSIHVLGQDTGCELAVHVASRLPERTASLTLFNPVCHDAKSFILGGTPIRSRQQFLAALGRQCEGAPGSIAALSAPYPDAGHMAGMLQQLNPTANDMAPSPVRVTAGCASQSVVHVGEAFFAEYLRFQSKFGLTFSLEKHIGSYTYLGLAMPELWSNVLNRIGNNG